MRFSPKRLCFFDPVFMVGAAIVTGQQNAMTVLEGKLILDKAIAKHTVWIVLGSDLFKCINVWV